MGARRRVLLIGMAAGPLPLGAWSLGPGDVDLKSYLNQPLNAEIEILTIDWSVVASPATRLALRADSILKGLFMAIFHVSDHKL